MYGVAVVKKLVTHYGGQPYTEIELGGFDLFIYNDVTIIQIPKTGRVEFEFIEAVAMGQLGLPWHEFDYWLGQNT